MSRHQQQHLVEHLMYLQLLVLLGVMQKPRRPCLRQMQGQSQCRSDQILLWIGMFWLCSLHCTQDMTGQLGNTDVTLLFKHP
jgi:hypothetical protein